MVKSQGWEQYRKFLDTKINISFVDPLGFKGDDNEELQAHRKVAYMKKIALEMLEWIDMKIEEAQELTKIERGEIVNNKRI